MSDSGCFSKREYAGMLGVLWEEVRRLELAVHSIDEIGESELFRYSPYKRSAPDQTVALGKILAVIGDGTDQVEPIMAEGMTGTGKTILAFFLPKALRDDPRYDDMSIRLIELVASLGNMFRKTLRNVSGLDRLDVLGPADVAKAVYGYRHGAQNVSTSSW